MTLKLGVVMDPIATITIKKDTTFAMLLAAQTRGWELHYFEQADLYARGNEALGWSRLLSVKDDKHGWFAFHGEGELPLAELDVILMRKDPPFDMEYIYTTYLLELAEKAGTLVVNQPRSLRDANEKFFALNFPHCCPPTLVSREPARLKAFLDEHADMVVKPLDGMGGASVFRLRQDDPNLNVILETLTAHGRRLTMAQRYIPEVTAGDKRAGSLRPGTDSAGWRDPGQPGSGRSRRRRSAQRTRPLDLHAGRSNAARDGSVVRRSGRDRRLSDGNQRHQPHLRAGTGRPVRAGYRRRTDGRHRTARAMVTSAGAG
jgi:hypothetical protein